MFSEHFPLAPNTEFANHIHCVLGDETEFAKTKKTSEQTFIGVFDSGMGGLSVLKHLIQQLPNEKYIYLADTKNVPYGEKTPTVIEELTLSAVSWLYQQGCKLVVIACNSASANCLPKLRQLYGTQVLIVGLVPALKPAIEATKTKQVAVLATQATLSGQLLNEVINTYAEPKNVTIHKYFEPSLVPWVEAGLPKEHQAHEKLKQILHKLNVLNIDSLVLGCTHYPFFSSLIAKYSKVKLYDSGLAVANRVESLLTQYDKQAKIHPLQQGKQMNNDIEFENCVNLVTKCIFFTTSGTTKRQKVIESLLYGFK